MHAILAGALAGAGIGAAVGALAGVLIALGGNWPSLQYDFPCITPTLTLRRVFFTDWGTGWTLSQDRAAPKRPDAKHRRER